MAFFLAAPWIATLHTPHSVPTPAGTGIPQTELSPPASLCHYAQPAVLPAYPSHYPGTSVCFSPTPSTSLGNLPPFSALVFLKLKKKKNRNGDIDTEKMCKFLNFKRSPASYVHGSEDLLLGCQYPPSGSTQSVQSLSQLASLKKTEKLTLKFIRKFKGPRIVQINPEKEDQSWRTHTPQFPNLLQSNSNQDSIVLM